jgi:glutamate synthase domain-containing protein 3
VVGGSVGSFSAFMAQAGNLVILGDAGDALGDSLYEVRIFVRGKVKSLGADCEEKPMDDEAKKILTDLLRKSGHQDVSPDSFKLFGSARTLYNFHVDHAGAY